MIRTSDFDYDLPPELIAQTPLEPRDSSRLLVLHRDTGRLEHQGFADLPAYLRPGDVMVFNQSRVLPARLHGYRQDTGGKVELLLLHRETPGIWRALAKPGRRLRPGAKVIIMPSRPDEKSLVNPAFIKGGTGGFSGVDNGGLTAEVLASHPDGVKTVRLDPEEEILRLGEMPLPPYIYQPLDDPERYQTIYSKEPGSAAAPTAGLHFTQELLGKIKSAGVELAYVTLHVGLDTFRPVQGEDPTTHEIHSEYYHLSAEAAGTISKAKEEGRRVIAVGTTSVRVVEHAAQLAAKAGETRLAPSTGQADLFILPGHRFRVVDALVTNFHLPRSTLLMLVSAFAGRERALQAYREAIRERYRFYSFGDAMLIL